MSQNQFFKVLKYNFILFLISLVLACSKADDFPLNDDLLLNSKLIDTTSIEARNFSDNLFKLKNLNICALGIVNDANFGISKYGFFADYETTTSSTSFSFSSIDSVYLIIPYSQKFGAFNAPIDIGVFELTERIVSTTADSFQEYSFNPTAVGELKNFIPNLTDSIPDGSTKAVASLRVPLTNAFGQKLIAKGSYSSQEELKTVLNGLMLIPTSNNPSNGIVTLRLASNHRIVIYGKNAAGVSISSVFISGGINSTTVNYSKNSYNGNAEAAVLNPSLKPEGLYLMGTRGYFSKIYIPSLASITKDNIILKAEIEFTVRDTGYWSTPRLGLLEYDSINNREITLLDYLTNSNFCTLKTENGQKKYVFNITSFITSATNRRRILHLLSDEVLESGNFKDEFSNTYPTRTVIEGFGNDATKPKLKLYLLKK